MRRYWIEFDLSNYERPPVSIDMGLGVTAQSREDALSLVRDRVFGGRELPPVRQVIDDVDVSTLDPGHVRPNMGAPTWRGIWFPLGFA